MILFIERWCSVSIKSTKEITRKEALQNIGGALYNLSDRVLGDILDLIADSEETDFCNRFDNFIVH